MKIEKTDYKTKNTEELQDFVVKFLVNEYISNQNHESELELIYKELEQRERLDVYNEATKNSSEIIFNTIEKLNKLKDSSITDFHTVSSNEIESALQKEKIESISQESLSLLPEDENFLIAKVNGDSMIQANIFDGDEIIIEKDAEIYSNDIVIISIDNEFQVKRYIENEEGKWIVPENDKYQPVKLDEFIDIKFFGVVKSVIHNFKKSGQP